MNDILMNVQRQVEQEWLSSLRRDIRSMEHLRYVHILPSKPPLNTYVVEGDIGECTICQDEFKVGQEIVVLPCNPDHPHTFHKVCIQPWLRGHDTCPTCRGKV